MNLVRSIRSRGLRGSVFRHTMLGALLSIVLACAPTRLIGVGQRGSNESDGVPIMTRAGRDEAENAVRRVLADSGFTVDEQSTGDSRLQTLPRVRPDGSMQIWVEFMSAEHPDGTQLVLLLTARHSTSSTREPASRTTAERSPVYWKTLRDLSNAIALSLRSTDRQ